jgi:CRISPR-associated endonuclease Csn1
MVDSLFQQFQVSTKRGQHQVHMVLVEDQGRKRIMRVAKFSQNGQIAFAEHREGGNLKERDADKSDCFKYLLKNSGALSSLKARRVTIDFLGLVHDPGFEP